MASGCRLANSRTIATKKLFMPRFIRWTSLACTALLVLAVVVLIMVAGRQRKTTAFLDRYETTDLTALGFTYVAALNDKGQVVGCNEREDIFIWDKTNGLSVVNIRKNCFVMAFNNSGQIAGSYQEPNGFGMAFIWDANNGLVNLGTLGGTTSHATAINDSGQVIGRSADPNGQTHHFFWDRDTGMLNLSDYNSMGAFGVNNSGTVVGTFRSSKGLQAVAWNKQGGLVHLTTPKGRGGIAHRISRSGKIAGTSGMWHDVLIWDNPETCRNVGSIGKDTLHHVHSINDTGQILGTFTYRAILSTRSHVFFFSDETGFVDLGESGFSPERPTWNLLRRSQSRRDQPPCQPSMNNRGQILRAVQGSDGKYRAILMTPKAGVLGEKVEAPEVRLDETNKILHITPRSDWNKALDHGQYHTETLDTEGYIHCSKRSQIIEVANHLFKGQKGLVLLAIDTRRVKPEIRWEGQDQDSLFPHIYGPLNLDAVKKVIDFPPSEDGTFQLPDQ